MMKWPEEIRGAAVYSLITLATYLFLQTLIVVTHEFIHSTTAYLLGDMQSPFAIEWGNPLTLTGWDEGVAYSHLFSAGQGTDAAIIAVMPLLFHAIVVSCGIFLLLSRGMLRRKWEFHLIFWFIIVNLTEADCVYAIQGVHTAWRYREHQPRAGAQPRGAFHPGNHPDSCLALLSSPACVAPGKCHSCRKIPADTVRNPHRLHIFPVLVDQWHSVGSGQLSERSPVDPGTFRICSIRPGHLVLPAGNTMDYCVRRARHP